jgi:hypothetical protein
LPILHALAEGVADERIPVRDACAMALCDAINDRHSYAVPPGILIDVLVHILSPVIRVLGDYLITDLNKQSLNQATTSIGLSLEEMTGGAAAGTGLTMKRPTQVVPHHLPQQQQSLSHPTQQQHENEWITVDSDGAADNHSQSSTLENNPNSSTAGNPNSVKNELSMTSELMNSSNYPQNLSQLTTSGGQPMTITSLLNIESNVIVKCIETLTTVFMKHVKKLSYYPSFDKLWLQLLQILTYFIELLPGEGEMMTNTTAPAVPSTVPVAPSAVMTATTTHLPPPPPNASPSSALYKDIYYQIISQLSKICCVKLEMVIRCLQKEKVFLKKVSLWIVTKEFLSQLQNSNPQHPHTQTLISFLN